jgi:hypothetical protein
VLEGRELFVWVLNYRDVVPFEVLGGTANEVGATGLSFYLILLQVVAEFVR